MKTRIALMMLLLASALLSGCNRAAVHEVPPAPPVPVATSPVTPMAVVTATAMATATPVTTPTPTTMATSPVTPTATVAVTAVPTVQMPTTTVVAPVATVTAPLTTAVVINDYQFPGLPEVSTSGDFIQVEVVVTDRDLLETMGITPVGEGPWEVEVLIPAHLAQGGRFLITPPPEGIDFDFGHVWEWSGDMGLILRLVQEHSERRRAGGAPNVGVTTHWEWLATPAVPSNTPIPTPTSP